MLKTNGLRTVLSMLLLFSFVFPVQAQSSYRWFKFYDDQPETFFMDFLCEDDGHWSFYRGEVKEEKLRARFLTMTFLKEGHKDLDEKGDYVDLTITPTLEDDDRSQNLYTYDAGGLDTFKGKIYDPDYDQVVTFVFSPDKGVLHYHYLSRRGDKRIWEASCRRLKLYYLPEKK